MRRVVFYVFLGVIAAGLAAGVAYTKAANGAAPGPPTVPVAETNLDSDGFIRVHEQGTTNVALSSGDLAKLDTANTHLSAIEAQANKLSFNSSGELRTAAPAGGAATKIFSRSFSIDNDNSEHHVDFGVTIDASLVVVANADDDVVILFEKGVFPTSNDVTLHLNGSGHDGATNYNLPLTQPITINSVSFLCDNSVSNCRLSITVVGS